MGNEAKFSGRAKQYTAYRPGYPKELFDFLVEEVMLTKDSVIADVGAGTGIFTKELTNVCLFVYGIEPNEDMRKACQCHMESCSNYELIDGIGEVTQLADDSVDFVSVAQAFHWFNQEKAKAEFKRILKENGKVILVWNSRDNTSPLVKENDELFRRICPKYKGFSGGIDDDEGMFSRLFRNGEYVYKQFENHLALNLEGFLGRCQSASYAPLENEDTYYLFIDELTGLFDKYCVDGVVVLPQYTRVYVGRV